MQELSSVPRLPKLSLGGVVEGIEEVSTLPQIALRVMEVANDPDSAASDLKEVMEGDAMVLADDLEREIAANESLFQV